MRASVVVLTFNAAERIDQVLTAVLRQESDFAWELLVIDSGSRDGTLATVRRHAEAHAERVRLHEIPNEEFGHGSTRNLAASLARGEFVLYLTHDAVPAHKRWLASMLHPFEISDRVACVYGKQIPWPRCVPTVKRDVMNCFRGFGPDNAISVHEKDGLSVHPAHPSVPIFFSDVNSAVRRSILLGPIPYRDLPYAEDQAFGQDVLDAGYLKVYTPLGAVFHSHNYSPLAYYRRMYDEMRGLRRATGRSLDTSLRTHLAWIGKATAADWRFIRRDPAYSRREKAKWTAEAPLYNTARRVAIHLSADDRLPAWVSRFSSLETSLKKVA